ncbi:MAG: hypothetical protein OXI96_04825 [Acidimicrobiaceae bacterium]|nr:hypothetical protein [Acidimicrobiaceae bacterium]
METTSDPDSCPQNVRGKPEVRCGASTKASGQPSQPVQSCSPPREASALSREDESLSAAERETER